MHADENARKIQHRREDRPDDDVRVWETYVVYHQERRRAHDRRHDLPAGRGCGLHRAGKLRLIAHFLHHGDRNGARTHGVGDGGTGYHALESAGNDGGLRRTAGRPAGERVCKLYEEVGNAGALKKCAEDDEYGDVLGADVDRRGENARLFIEERADERLERPCAEPALDAVVVERVCNEDARHDHDGHAGAPAAELKERENADHAEHDLVRLERRELLHDGVGVEAEIEERYRAERHDDPVVPGDIVHAELVLVAGENEKACDQQPADERREPYLVEHRAKQRDIHLENRECREIRLHSDLRLALPGAGIRFAVILAHDLVEIFCRVVRHGATSRKKNLLYTQRGGAEPLPYGNSRLSCRGGICSARGALRPRREETAGRISRRSRR